ncbi:potassium channel, subfamily K, member 16-like [Saccoglossus kowalevskii]|uniref:Potassium channel subfamily K member 16-like n=1 Tax=Saccoglossus kowalevskii TaxID=10224 RepID=A0ABM0MQG8_SACKO|nr:PREDICTED: potassium channel subfamily K member 16-like [Saccoglossus kowalevskii]
MRSSVSAFLVMLGLLIYLTIGAFIFMALEQPHETHIRLNTKDFLLNFLDNNTCVTESELRTVIDELILAYDQGVTPLKNVTSPSNWDFPNAFFFVTTVVTTIGYGNLSPNTFWGQIFLLFYATVGIPITFIALASVTRFLKVSYRLYQRRSECYFSCIKHDGVRKFIQFAIFASVVYAVLIVGPSAVFAYLEDWSMHIAHYYTFVTLSTIGFGDYVASYSEKIHGYWRIVYKIVLAIYFVIGISLINIVFGFAQSIQEREGKKLAKRAKVHQENLMKLHDRNSNVGLSIFQSKRNSSVNTGEDEKRVVSTYL